MVSYSHFVVTMAVSVTAYSSSEFNRCQDTERWKLYCRPGIMDRPVSADRSSEAQFNNQTAEDVEHVQLQLNASDIIIMKLCCL